MVELESIPTVLHVPKNALGNKIVVGFSDGRVILFRINPMAMDGKFNTLFLLKCLFNYKPVCILHCSKARDSCRYER